jgi:hypothetical protein
MMPISALDYRLQRFALTWNPRNFLKAARSADEQKISCTT